MQNENIVEVAKREKKEIRDAMVEPYGIGECQV